MAREPVQQWFVGGAQRKQRRLCLRTAVPSQPDLAEGPLHLDKRVGSQTVSAIIAGGRYAKRVRHFDQHFRAMLNVIRACSGERSRTPTRMRAQQSITAATAASQD
jgi:hypothetical protein